MINWKVSEIIEDKSCTCFLSSSPDASSRVVTFIPLEESSQGHIQVKKNNIYQIRLAHVADDEWWAERREFSALHILALSPNLCCMMYGMLSSPRWSLEAFHFLIVLVYSLLFHMQFSVTCNVTTNFYVLTSLLAVWQYFTCYVQHWTNECPQRGLPLIAKLLNTQRSLFHVAFQ